MEQLIAEFLFTNKQCALPKVGTLVIRQTSTEQSVVDKSISPPLNKIEFRNTISNPNSFIEFIQNKRNCSPSQASELLDQFCNVLKDLKDSQRVAINNVGEFCVDKEGQLTFTSIVLPEVFYPSLQVNRVVHPKATHQVRVGDNEKSNAYMQGYLKDSKVKKGNQWLMLFLVLLLLSLTILIHYFTHLEDYRQENSSIKNKKHTVESVR